MLRRFVALSAALSLVAAVRAQCFTPVGGTSIAAGLIQFTGLEPVHDEGRSPVTPLGFAFPVPGGGTYTHCVIESNGLIYLCNGVNPPFLANYVYGSPTNLAGAPGSGPRLAPYWRDLQAAPAGWDITTATVPGVSFTVRWLNVCNFFTTGPAKSFAVTMYANGDVDYAYGSITVQADAFVGISIGNGVGGVQPPSNFLGAPVGGTVPQLHEAFTAADWDLSNETLRFSINGLGGWNVSRQCSPATHSVYGAGCYATPDSFYQQFATAAAAAPVLQNRAITITPTGGLNHYTVTNAGTFRPVGSVQAVPTIVANGDDVAQTVPFTVGSFPGSTGLSICSNGIVSMAAGNSTFWDVNVSTFLNDPQRSFRSWHDMNPTIPGSGQIKYEESATVTMVTWDGVWDWLGTTAADANTLQMQFYPTGVVVMCWGTMSSLGASFTGHLVGFSPAGPSVNPGSVNLLGSLPFVHAPLTAMSLSATPAPISTVSSGTLVTYTQSLIPEAAPGSGVYLGLTIVSVGQDLAGTDLAFLGAGGCRLHVSSLDVTIAFVGGANSLNTSFLVPAGAPVGFQLFAQSAAIIQPFSLPNGQNAFGLTLSNAIASYISNH